MMDDGKDARGTGKEGSEAEYERMLELEDLESLLEELDEIGVKGNLVGADLPDEAAELVASLGLTDVGQIRARVAELHAELDPQEGS